jgi:hypothetical protein
MLVSKALATKIGAGVAAAAIAVGGGAAVANASSTPSLQHKHKLATTLSIAGGEGHVRKNGTTIDWIRGRLTSHGSGIGDATIHLARFEHGRWVWKQHEVTGRNGYVLFHVYALARGASFRLRYTGNINFAGTRSDIITIAPVKKK